MELEEYKFPVYGTQGGGLARVVNGIFIFVEAPNCPGLDVGNEVPKQWDIQPANSLARNGEADKREVFFDSGWEW